MVLSIIIPVYNGASTIKRCLESIYNQNINLDNVEIIVVDDCSTDNTIDVIKTISPALPNFTLINLPVNSRQGTARNRGVSVANGKYVSYLDADDCLVEHSLASLLNRLYNCECDLLMYDCQTRSDDCNTLINSSLFIGNPREILTGEKYLTNAEVPWVPWLTAFNRDYLFRNNIQFAEGVRFEDTDYMLKSVLLAKTVVYYPIEFVCHTINPQSTVHIGNDFKKVSERFLTSTRIFSIIKNYQELYPEGTKAVFGHYNFRHNSLLKTTLWRLKYSEIIKILNAFPYQGDISTGLVGLTSKHPKLYALASQVIRPLLIAGVKLRNTIRKR